MEILQLLCSRRYCPDNSPQLDYSLPCITQLTDSQSESELLYDWRFTANQFFLAPSPLRLAARIFFLFNTRGHSPYITSSMTGEWVCHLQLLLALASSFILGSEYRGNRDHILLSQIWDFPFCRLLRLAGLRWRYVKSQSQSYVTTDG
jgi:hypothetical protein